jgi:hypothetical protein
MAGKLRRLTKVPRLYLYEYSVFLNIPYEDASRQFRPLQWFHSRLLGQDLALKRALAYISGLTAFGLTPVLGSAVEHAYRGNFVENSGLFHQSDDTQPHYSCNGGRWRLGSCQTRSAFRSQRAIELNGAPILVGATQIRFIAFWI